MRGREGGVREEVKESRAEWRAEPLWTTLSRGRRVKGGRPNRRRPSNPNTTHPSTDWGWEGVSEGGVGR